jgi:hypothetical protein
MAKQEDEKTKIEELAAFTDRLTAGKRIKPVEDSALRELADTVAKIHCLLNCRSPPPSQLSASGLKKWSPACWVRKISGRASLHRRSERCEGLESSFPLSRLQL